jgi:hypothetical protein
MENEKQPISPTLTYNELSGQPNGHLLGLTKREYFAGLAMQGLLSNPELIKAGSFDFISKGTEKRISQIATNISDALLAELDKTKTE